MVCSGYIRETGPTQPLYLFKLKTRPSHRRQGLARKLLAQIAHSYPGRSIKLRAHSYNPALTTEKLITFYESCGFKWKPGTVTLTRPGTKLAALLKHTTQ